MQIINFDRIRIGHGYPVSLDITPLNEKSHSDYGMIASINTYQRKDDQHYFQLIKHNKTTEFALCIFKWEGMPIDPYWEDSTIVFDSRDDL